MVKALKGYLRMSTSDRLQSVRNKLIVNEVSGVPQMVSVKTPSSKLQRWTACIYTDSVVVVSNKQSFVSNGRERLQPAATLNVIGPLSRSLHASDGASVEPAFSLESSQ